MPRGPVRNVPTVIIHGWQGNEPEHWQTWLAGQLTAAGRDSAGEPGSGNGAASWYHKANVGQAAMLQVANQCPFKSGSCYAIADRATYAKPHQYPTGVKWVLVNGHAEVADGAHKPDVLGGRPLRHPGK